MTHEPMSDDGHSVDQSVHPRAYTADLPVTGAWRSGDPVGDRLFATVGGGRPFVLEGGGVLTEVAMAFETWGELSAAADNAILICHALTGDSHAHGQAGVAHATPGWWNGVIGPGCGIDTDQYFVVCVNSLGGCQGSTGAVQRRPSKRHGTVDQRECSGSTEDVVSSGARRSPGPDRSCTAPTSA